MRYLVFRFGNCFTNAWQNNRAALHSLRVKIVETFDPILLSGQLDGLI